MPAGTIGSGRNCRRCSPKREIGNYSIYLDPESNSLFAYLERHEDHQMDRLPGHPLMRQWWDYMRDIMRTHPDGAPVVVELMPMFHLQGAAG